VFKQRLAPFPEIALRERCSARQVALKDSMDRITPRLPDMPCVGNALLSGIVLVKTQGSSYRDRDRLPFPDVLVRLLQELQVDRLRC